MFQSSQVRQRVTDNHKLQTTNNKRIPPIVGTNLKPQTSNLKLLTSNFQLTTANIATVKSFLKLLLKLTVTGLCLWYVGQKINWIDTWRLLQQSGKGWLVVAAVLFVLSKMVSALRLSKYFGNIGIHLSQGDNLRLYWLGMFYNLFLPGGIGGDAYKVILLNKRYEAISAKKITAAVLLDRISGVVGLGILGALFFGFIYASAWYGWGMVVAILPGLMLYHWTVQRWFPSFVSSFVPTLWLGLGVQALQVLCISAIMASVGINHHFAVFQFLFLLSSIVAIFPFTIGGLGARELVFLWGAQTFGLLTHEAVFISLLFYLITVVASLAGLIWVFRPALESDTGVKKESA
jgi:uncharacterized membrane protein YbhN (UPF0104 family)